MPSSRLLLLALPGLLAACGHEKDIDRTVLSGTVQILPATADEGGDGRGGPNDAGLVELPVVTYRYMTVTGSAREFADTPDTEGADVDAYLLKMDAAGRPTLTFRWETGTELYMPSRDELLDGESPRFRDTVSYKVEIIDPAWTEERVEDGEIVTDYHVYATFDDELTGGELSFDWAEDVSVSTAGAGSDSPYAEDGVPAGTQLGIRVTAVRGDGQGDGTYSFDISGVEPGDGDIVIGAYMSGDPTDRGNPVGGGSAYGWTFDDTTKTWTGNYILMEGLKRVVACDPGDTECQDSISGEDATGGTSGDADGSAESARLARANRATVGLDLPPDSGTTDSGTTDSGATDSGSTDGGTDSGSTDGGADSGTGTDGGADSGTGDDGGADSGTGDDGGADSGTGDDGGADSGGDGGTGDGGTGDGGTGDGGTDGDEGAEEIIPENHVNEGVNSVYLMAGTFSTLHGSIPGGTLYSSEMVFAEVTGEHTVVDGVIQIDDLSPKVYGWTFVEEGDGASDAPLALPIATGAGFVDVIEGSMTFSIDNPQYNNENEGYLITVPEDLGCLVTLYWYDAATNLDVYILNSDQEAIAAGYVVGDVDGGPESFSAGGDFGITFEPGKSYIVSVEAWTGPAGEKPYTIELEWVSP
ncbi:MAG: hypothetical protein H6742_16185 [Alphaproteobacteria bacterium]|nr:hypothetical protein [Alphaproteobacteria bacterium]